jgi:hypothetical protein
MDTNLTKTALSDCPNKGTETSVKKRKGSNDLNIKDQTFR